MFRVTFFIVYLLVPMCLFSQAPSKTEALGMKDCLLRAIQYNLTLESERYNPQIQELGLQIAESVFDPSLSSSFLIAETENEMIRVRSNGELFSDTSKSRSLDWNVGVNKPYKLGGNLSLSYGIDYNKQFSQSSGFRNPQWGHGLTLSVSQSLLRNLGVEVNSTEINRAKNEITRSQYLLENQIIATLANVQTAYWSLVNAIENYELKRKSLEQAQNLHKITLARIKAGSLAAADILEAEQNVAVKQDSLVISERNIYEAEDRLKQLIRPLDADYYKNVRILPVEKPIFRQIEFDFDQILKEARLLRPDLKASELNLKNSQLSIARNKNQLLPDLSVSGNISLNGKGNVSSEAWDGMKDTDQLSWGIQLSLNIPLGNRAAKSRYEQSLLQDKQIILQHRNLEDFVILEVRSATRNLQTAMTRVQTARKSKELAEKQLANEENKFRAGIITLFQVQDTEEKLSQARISESDALLDYLNALVQLEKVKGTLLKKIKEEYSIEIPLAKGLERNF